MAPVTMRDLLEAGIHFGHQTRRWNPKMARYIFGQRNGIYIIDLKQTLRQLTQAYNTVRDTVADGGLVLFVGTKKQAQEAIKRESERCGMYHVNSRWLGGTLTNWETIRRSIRKLHRLEGMETSGALDKLPKKEVVMLRKQREKMAKHLSGIKNMDRQPDILFVIDTKKEAIAIKEAERLKIPCIGVVDTNCDPDPIPIPVPGNDDAIRAVNLFCRVIADAVIEGMSEAEKRQAEEEKRQEQVRKERLERARAQAASQPEASAGDAESAPAAEAATAPDAAPEAAPEGGNGAAPLDAGEDAGTSAEEINSEQQ